MVPIPREQDFLNADGVVNDVRLHREIQRSIAERQQLMFRCAADVVTKFGASDARL